LPEPLWYQKGAEFGKDNMKRQGYWLSGTKAKVLDVQRVPESSVCAGTCNAGRDKGEFAAGRAARHLEEAS